MRFSIEKHLDIIFNKIQWASKSTPWLEGAKEQTAKHEAIIGHNPPSLIELEQNRVADLVWLRNKAKLELGHLNKSFKKASATERVKIRHEIEAIRPEIKERMKQLDGWVCTQKVPCLRSCCAKCEGLYQMAMVHATCGFLSNKKAYQHESERPILATYVIDFIPAYGEEGINSTNISEQVANYKAYAMEICKKANVEYFIGCWDVNYRMDTTTHKDEAEKLAPYWSLHLHAIIKKSDYDRSRDLWVAELGDKSLSQSYIHGEEIAYKSAADIGQISATAAYVFKRMTEIHAYSCQVAYTYKTKKGKLTTNTRLRFLKTEQRVNLLNFLDKFWVYDKAVLYGVEISSSPSGYGFIKPHLLPPS